LFSIEGKKMQSWFLDKTRGMWVFILAASTAPLTYLVATPCGLACGACPLIGTCLIAYPTVIVVAIALKFYNGIKSTATKLLK